MPAGNRDRLIKFMQRIGVQSPTTGAWSYSWQETGRAWAQVQDYLPSRGEQIADNIDIARRPCRIRFPYRAGITSAMRVVIDGRSLGIVAGPAEMGRRKMIEIVAEELSTDGQA